MDLLKMFAENNIMLREFFDSFSSGIIITDKQSRVMYSNAYSKKFLKCDLTGMFPFQWLEKIPLYTLKGVPLTEEELTLNQILDRGSVLNFKALALVEGYEHYLVIKVSPFKNQEGFIMGACFNYQDITEEYLQEKTILNKQNFFQRLLDLIPAAIMMKNLDGSYVFSNKSFNEAFSNGPVPGKKTMNVFSFETLKMINKHNAQVLEQEKILEFIEKLPHLDGSMHTYRTIRFPTYNEEKKINGVCGIALDETEKIAQQMIIDKERIKNINASKLAALGTLAAEIGHEINNPLGIIKTSVMVLREMLLKNDSIENQLLQIEVINQTLERINHIVKALKFLSRDSTSEDFAFCSVNDIISDTEILIRTKLKLKNVSYHFDKGEVDLGSKISCNRIQISQVLLNLFVNAVDAVAEKKNPEIHLNLEQDEEFLYFKVSDNGPGIPPDLKVKIFEPFFTTKKLGMGTGLGLSISKDIMMKHYGDLFLSDVESGGCFIMKLPWQA